MKKVKKKIILWYDGIFQEAPMPIALMTITVALIIIWGLLELLIGQKL